ncbi:CLUMA_CG018636, isoform A [Clunio marinus]|uniref:CLUMA_CG018636, isoform A n=1 Tax=Clunio marinus TaxID=568069 RepID=A0A1J1IZ72_9DIPT|nr:CLUMA_CG018636, isoform A [Clunio marinus]
MKEQSIQKTGHVIVIEGILSNKCIKEVTESHCKTEHHNNFSMKCSEAFYSKINDNNCHGSQGRDT